MKKYLKCIFTCLICVLLLGMSGCGKKVSDTNEFKPVLDTESKVLINIAGFFGNFEALDQVTNDFNQYYPNVEFIYEQVSSEKYMSYMEANSNVDIIMTSEDVLEKYGSQAESLYVDLSKENINMTDIDDRFLKMAYHDGKLLYIPMGQNVYGLVVNETLLEKEGLTIPKNYNEFINALTVLKEKGYTPIQGPESKVYAELVESMAYDLIMSDSSLYNDIISGNESAVDKLMPVMDKLNTIISKGYTDSSVNKTYPADNYDKAILKFFEGDVPFWVCNSEKVGGMKKRESKSETYQKEPFKYSYIYAPLGDDGAYVYAEPWVGFAVNKDASDYDYAVEFLRFMSTKDEINKMADIKGIPSVALNHTDMDIYNNIINPGTTEMNYVNDGNISNSMISNWYTCINKYATGGFATEREALKYYIELCSKN